MATPDGAAPRIIAAAVHRLKSFRGELKGISRDELINLKHEGHRF